jgi:hypothetical protein
MPSGIAYVRPSSLGIARARPSIIGLAVAVFAAAGSLLSGCSQAPPPSTDTEVPANVSPRPPAPPAAPPRQGGESLSIGFLDRDDVTVRMAGAGLIIDITPLNSEVVSLVTDDLRVYMEEALRKVPDTVPPDLQKEGTFFLIGFSSTEKEISFEPAQVHLDSEGRRYYPLYIVPVTAGFDNKILELFKPVWAVYVFEPGIDLLSTIEFGYGEDLSSRGSAWRQVILNVEEARGRARR